MSFNYVPASDGAFNAWLDNFAAFVELNFAEIGLDAGDVGKITDSRDAWHTDYAAHTTAHAAAKAAAVQKTAARARVVQQYREFVRRIQVFAGTTDSHRAALGITIRDTTRTPPPPPTSRPLVRIDASERLRHIVRFSDEASPTSRAKPRGFAGAEVWVRVAAPTDPLPSDPAQFRFLAQASRSPYRAEHAGADAGKTAHYLVRWVNTRGAKGPWSETASATIAM